MSVLRKKKWVAFYITVGTAALLLVGLMTQGCPGPGLVGNTVCLSCHDGRTAPDMREFLSSFHNAAGVQCEDCHGPGLLHVQNAGRDGLFIINPADESSSDLTALCNRCHSVEAGGFAKSVHSTNAVLRCDGCHDSHSASETRLPADDNELCQQCHAALGFSDDAAITAHTHHPVDPAGTGASRCIGCHMPPLERLNQSAGPFDHSLETIPPSQSNAAIAAGITPTPPNSCAGTMGCHDGTVPTAPIFNVDDSATNTLLQQLYDLWFGA